jgi:hypothetical protein
VVQSVVSLTRADTLPISRRRWKDASRRSAGRTACLPHRAGKVRTSSGC